MEYFIILALGILTRVILGFVNYTKSLALELSNEKNGTGYQNAITPPLFPLIASTIYGLSLFVIISGFFERAFITGFIYLGLYLLTPTIICSSESTFACLFAELSSILIFGIPISIALTIPPTSSISLINLLASTTILDVRLSR